MLYAHISHFNCTAIKFLESISVKMLTTEVASLSASFTQIKVEAVKIETTQEGSTFLKNLLK